MDGLSDSVASATIERVDRRPLSREPWKADADDLEAIQIDALVVEHPDRRLLQEAEGSREPRVAFVVSRHEEDAPASLQIVERIFEPVEVRAGSVEEIPGDEHDLWIQGVHHPHHALEETDSMRAAEVHIRKLHHGAAFPPLGQVTDLHLERRDDRVIGVPEAVQGGRKRERGCNGDRNRHVERPPQQSRHPMNRPGEQ